mgnify:CR=1 FL=1
MDKIREGIYFSDMVGGRSWFSSYLPVNSEAYEWEIYCHDVGHTEVPPGSPYPPKPDAHPREFSESVMRGRVLAEFQVIYLSEGAGWFWSEPSGRLEVKAGNVCVVFPGIKHAYSPHPDIGWTENWIGFAGPHANRLWRNGILDPSQPVFDIGLHDDLLAMYEDATSLCREQTPGFQIRLGALVLQIVATVQALHEYGKQQHTAAELVRRARYLMQQKVETGARIVDIAEWLGVSYASLLRTFRRYTGLTPYQYFLQMRIHRAEELLKTPDIRVKEVAARLSFDNQYYFARIFKKKTGLTPSEWHRAGTATS